MIELDSYDNCIDLVKTLNEIINLHKSGDFIDYFYCKTKVDINKLQDFLFDIELVLKNIDKSNKRITKKLKRVVNNDFIYSQIIKKQNNFISLHVCYLRNNNIFIYIKAKYREEFELFDKNVMNKMKNELRRLRRELTCKTLKSFQILTAVEYSMTFHKRIFNDYGFWI